MSAQTVPHAFVMGHPVAHSRSPMLHRYWLELLGIEGTYELCDVAPEALGAFFARFAEEGYVGGNVTVPHKTAVMAHVDEIDAAARAIGAVNTLWVEDGVLWGGNTDAVGFLGNLDERAPGWREGGRRAVVLGAGGACRAVTFGLRESGFEVAIVNRTLAHAEAIALRFGAGVSAHPMGAVHGLMAEADLLVNTTSLGMSGKPPLTVDLAPLKASAVVCDIVYVPLRTALLEQAAARGHRTVDGLGMLIHQAVPGFARWFGATPPVTAELRGLLEADIGGATP